MKWSVIFRDLNHQYFRPKYSIHVFTIPDSYKVFKNFHFGGRIRMPDSPDMSERKPDPERKSCGFKNIRVCVDWA